MSDKQKDDFLDLHPKKEEVNLEELVIREEIDSNRWIKKIEILNEILPNLRKFIGETFVIKLGSSIIDPNYLKNIASNIVVLKQAGINPIIVHGGGAQINQMLSKLNIQPSFIDGLRVTDLNTMDIVEMVLAGLINKNIVKEINLAGASAVGLSGKDGNLIGAKKLTKIKKDPYSNIEQILNLGFVGEPYKINSEILGIFEESEVIPVIAPIGIGDNGETFNLNANEVALALACAVNASKLIILTNKDGIILNSGKSISLLSSNIARNLIKEKLVNIESISKLSTCLSALENNVATTHILNGSLENSLLIEIFTKEGSGTMIYQ